MPLQSAVNVVDCFFYDGIKAIFQIGLAILDATAVELCNSKDDGQALVVLSRFLEHLKNEESPLPPIGNLHSLLNNDQPEVLPVTDIMDLIRDSYEKFGNNSVEQIEHLRCKHRILVLQNHEETTKQNVLRVVSPDVSFIHEHLEELYDMFKREHFISCYWEGKCSLLERHDPSRPYAEQYKIDRWQFTNLFRLCSPWICGTHTEVLAERLFRLLDENLDSLIEFKAFVSCLDVMYYGEMNEKMKLLYKLHIPPALSENDHDCQSPLKGPLLSTNRPLKIVKANGEKKDYQKQLKQMLRDLARDQDKKSEKELPKMTQREFIQFCKTLYSLFHEDPTENDLYQSIATVTTLLLQIGEVGQRSSSSGSTSEEFSSVDQQNDASTSDQDSVFLDAAKSPSNTSPPLCESDWLISFEHILASLLTEQSLVNFFEKPLDIKPKLECVKTNPYGLKINGTVTLPPGLHL
ncbi:hypothetical protein GDO86_001434 [Hymenochirus boettgeri]|uniref:TBC1 domain family member 8 n=1 Tax=Hymenochirus boettgeri TaxID=247094 RepID=A0A8T2KCP9_9PIPI|nr:hypothetical protein GDO86_001434 [Hymenochirus boettgeri]